MNFGSPRRPKGPSAAEATVEHTSITAAHSSEPSMARAMSSLSLFGQPKTPQKPRARNETTSPGASVGSTAPSTIASVLESSASAVHTASPSTAHEWTRTLTKVLEAAKQFAQALEYLSQASDKFGHALEEASQKKPCGDSSEAIGVSGSLHLLISNHLQILQSTIYSKLVQPLEISINTYSQTLEERESHFRADLKAAKNALAEAENRSRLAQRSKTRNLNEYRSILLDITAQIDDINRLKYEFLCDLYGQASGEADTLKQSLSACIGAELEIFESIGRKGWSGGGLDSVLTEDPFDSAQHFTMLPRRPLLSDDEGDGDETIRDDIEVASGDQSIGTPRGSDPPTAAGSTQNILQDL